MVEVGGGVLADGADIVRRQRFALVDIAADAADPMMELFILRGGGLGLGFWLDMGKIVGIGGAGQVVLGAGFGDLRDKQGMAAAIDGGDHLPADDGIGDLPVRCSRPLVLRAQPSKPSNLSTSRPLWKPNRRNSAKGAFSVRMETLKPPVRRIISWVKLALFTAIRILWGSAVTCMEVLMMQPLSFSPSRAVRTNRP